MISDNCEAAWKFYKKLYGEKIKESKKGYCYEYKEDKQIKINGEVCFNVKLKNGKNFSFFGSILKKKMDEEKIQTLKKYLDEVLYSKCNICIMPQTGGLNIIKKNIGNDRIDTFIWALGKYYKGAHALILNSGAKSMAVENREILKDFLSNYDEIKFSEELYQIDEEMVKKFKRSGGNSIMDLDALKKYVSLAIEFWECRLDYFMKKGICADQEKNLYEENFEQIKRILSI